MGLPPTLAPALRVLASLASQVQTRLAPAKVAPAKVAPAKVAPTKVAPAKAQALLDPAHLKANLAPLLAPKDQEEALETLAATATPVTLEALALVKTAMALPNPVSNLHLQALTAEATATPMVTAVTTTIITMVSQQLVKVLPLLVLLDKAAAASVNQEIVAAQDQVLEVSLTNLAPQVSNLALTVAMETNLME